MMRTQPLRSPDSATASGNSGPAIDARSSIKETLVSIIIAFALAFVFRGFVVEAFLIPTGSMAPTLMGQHELFTNPRNGYTWPVGPWQTIPGTNDPTPLQGTTRDPIIVHDPMTLERQDAKINIRPRAGDRIFVMKYLYSVYEPKRFDVVVFKNPNDPTINYIKRLLGLPGEQIALVDGDVFTRLSRSDDPATVANPWLLPGWKIARKSELAQRSMWQPVFNSFYSPLKSDNSRAFEAPWVPGSAGWDLSRGIEYVYSGEGETSLMWNVTTRPIKDYYAYNEAPMSRGKNDAFPVSDIRVSAAIKPLGDGLSASAIVKARGHDFRATLRPDPLKSGEAGAYQAVVEMRPDISNQATEAGWKALASVASPRPLRAREVVNFDFWHSDQSLQLFLDDTLVVRAEYDWSIGDRLSNALTVGGAWAEQAVQDQTMLANFRYYKAPNAGFQFSGGKFSMMRVALARDIHYQADVYPQYAPPNRPHSHAGKPATATSPVSTLRLTDQQFFTCGDNSPASYDARLWDNPDPWVAQIDPTMGVVNRDLLIGKAFFVYFPSPTWSHGIPIPDFGRMRFIW